MSAPLTPEREQEIRARVAAATEGPWASDGAEIYQGEAGAASPWIGETLDIENEARSNANAAFIAHAREDVPALLAEVERLRAELAARPTRAAVLREAADAVHAAFHGDPFLNYPPDFADHLRRLADAAERGEQS